MWLNGEHHMLAMRDVISPCLPGLEKNHAVQFIKHVYTEMWAVNFNEIMLHWFGT